VNSTERAYRLAMRQHDFDKQHLKVLDFVLFHSYGRPDARAKAWVPRQLCIAICTGMDDGDLSRTVKWLKAQRVIEQTADEDGAWFAMLPPGTWKVSLKVDSESMANDMEEWLYRADPGHPEFWEIPASLSDALREVFVESSSANGRAESRVEPSSDKASSWIGSKSVQRGITNDEVGKSPNPGNASPGGRVGEFPSQSRPGAGAPGFGVGNFPTSVPREREARAREDSRCSTSRERVLGLDKERVNVSDFQAYVERELFGLIGNEERGGECGLMWERAIRDMPEELNELIGQAKLLQQEGKITRSVGAWLNASVYRALERRKTERLRVAERR